MSKYICKDCSHEFPGSDYITNCPECDGTNFQKKSGRTLPSNYFKFLIGFLILIAIIIIGKCNKSETYTLQWNGPFSAPYQILLLNSEGKIKAYNKEFLNDITITVRDEWEGKIPLTNYQIWPCFLSGSDDEKLSITFKLNKGSRIALPNGKQSQTFNNTFKKRKENNSKMCYPNVEIKSVKLENSCQVTITPIDQFLLNKYPELEFSVNGKDGPWVNSYSIQLNKSNYNKNDNKDIWWRYKKGNPQEYEGNNSTYINKKCWAAKPIKKWVNDFLNSKLDDEELIDSLGPGYKFKWNNKLMTTNDFVDKIEREKSNKSDVNKLRVISISKKGKFTLITIGN